MDVEDELRSAMAERVADTRAPRSLASDVRRRHRRRKTRIRTATAVAGASVAALALVPTYRSIQPAPAGAPETVESSTGTPGSRAPERGPAPVPSRPSEPGKDGPAEPRTPRPSRGGAPDEPAVQAPRVRPSLPAWLGYLPDGLAAARPCTTERDTARTTTTCEWRGDAGWVKIRLIEGTGIGPADLAPSVGVPSRTTVRGTPALEGASPGSGRQISWLPRPGVGAIVQAGGAAADDLRRIAEGVRP